ncbi:NUDIX hydrolase [Cyclonatronum sp.]|uniref:NUDIX hydrolase n=1 Tax=Cyclonatronum sp. TaxID=3024185 RepID=UPI0025C6AC41|nr:NUDIX hydrolase [Cyclonatronum sp.]
MSETVYKPVTAAGGVVFTQIAGKPHVLMIYRNDVWDLPKGKLDKGESIPECAAREVSEETGCPLPEIKAELGTTLHQYTDKWGDFEKTTWWYAMQTKAKKFSPQTDEGITKVCWIELKRAREIAGFENLKEVLNRFASIFDEGSLS